MLMYFCVTVTVGKCITSYFLIHAGAFGRVYKGLFTRIMDDGACAEERVPVAVKTIKSKSNIYTSYSEPINMLQRESGSSSSATPMV